MSKETLEEALKKYVATMSLDQSVYIDFLQCAEFGAKWQQNKIDIYNAKMEKERAENREFLKFHKERSYSEEDMKEAFNVGFQVGYNDEISPSYLTAEKFIEQFKKK